MITLFVLVLKILLTQGGNMLKWCLRQKKGIRMIEPNELIAEDYVKKSDNSLRMMNTVDSEEWRIVGGYYACYECLYALLIKVGIKSEIHDCSIFLMNFFDFNKEDINFMKRLKQKRIDAQYYLKNIKFTEEDKVKDFILKCKEILHKSDFNSIRKKILKEVKK